MSNLVMVYTTWPEEKQAQAMGRVLIGDRLAACVNLLPAMKSLYAWEGAIEEAQEYILLIKTCAVLLDAVRNKVMAAHPYDVPAFLVLPVESQNTPYEAWLLSATHSSS